MQVFIDESGNLGKGRGKYFVITAVYTKSPNRLKNIVKRHCVKYKIPELKGTDLNLKTREGLIHAITHKDDYSISYIVLEKSKLRRKELFGSNLLFNYMMKLLFVKITEVTNEDLSLVFDNRAVRTNSKYSLPDYLKSELIGLPTKSKVSIQFSQSENSHGVQAADLIANTIYQYYEYGVKHLYDKLNIKTSIRYPQN